MKPKQVRRSALCAALDRAAKVRAAWNAAYPLGDHWQADLCEIMLLPGMWARMRRRADADGRGRTFSFYALRRFTCGRGLPGYILSNWNGEPRPGHECSHSPGTAWDGIRRNLYWSLAEGLRAVALGHDAPDYLAPWAIEVIDDVSLVQG